MESSHNSSKGFINLLKITFKIVRDIIILLMIVRTVTFLAWLLNKSPTDANLDPSKYDITIILTAIGWVILVVYFAQSQKKELSKKGDYSSLKYRIPIFWLFYTRKEKE